VLGIETSTTRCQVALAEAGTLVALAALPETVKATSSLVPTIASLARKAGWPLTELDLVCVDIGPGSYTGLRVGLTCAKTLAYAAGAALAPVESLDVVATNVPASECQIEVAFDAARGQVFAAHYINESRTGPTNRPTATTESFENSWTRREPIRIVDAHDWTMNLPVDSLVLGPALVKCRSKIAPDRCVADESQWWPTASNVIRLGVTEFLARPLRAYWSLEPIYLRASAAEEKRRASQSQ
jgi:tRNA threonylcarbamoyladenosine biosynthesis protein TsaB